MGDETIHLETVTSRRTEALFVVLVFVFFLPFFWFAHTGLLGGWCILFFCLTAFFAFYAINYRTLIIRMDEDIIRLKFGIFSWTIPISNVGGCFIDTSAAPRLGGAGIHFMVIRGRYTAMFNFIEYDRVVISFKKPKGPVRDIAFSSRQPEVWMGLIRKRAALDKDPG